MTGNGDDLWRSLLLERQQGMPRWHVKRPKQDAPIVPDSDLEIARRRKVLDDYYPAMEQVS